jgi:hypothetical protein
MIIFIKLSIFYIFQVNILTNSHLFYCTHYRNFTLKLIVKHNILSILQKKIPENYCAK